jgi:hypothetical protein
MLSASKGPQFFLTSDSPGKPARTFLAAGNGRTSRASIVFWQSLWKRLCGLAIKA